MATLGTASAAQYRYYRFNTTSTLGNGNLVQVSEFKFFSAGTPVVPLLPTSTPITGDGAVTNLSGAGSSPDAESPPNLVDKNTGTKWLHFGGSGVNRSVIFDFGTIVPPVIDSYTYVTAQGGTTLNGENSRNPDSWILEGSSDGTTWDTLDVRTDIAAPLAAQTELAPFVIPATIGPVINKFAVLPIVVLSGTTVDFEWDTDFTDTVTLSPGGPAGMTADGFTTLTPPITPGQVTDTTFTLEADSASAAPVTRQVKVRTVPGGTVTGQHVRFTPIMTEAGNIQMADIRFYKTVGEDQVEVIPTSCTYTDGTGGPTETGEIPNNLVDAAASTKWYSGTLRPVVFHFPASVSIESYSFVLGGDAAAWPGRNVRKWTMEISDDNFSWNSIEDFTAFEYPMPAVNNATVAFPLPGYEIQAPPDIFGFSAKRDLTLPGDPIVFSWNSTGGDTVTITPGDGEDLPAAGTKEYIAPADAVYTLTVTNNGGTATETLSFGAVDPLPTTIGYEDFSSAGDEIVLLGDATLVNDSYKIAAPGDVVRLRMTPDDFGKSGAAWFNQRVPVGNGFETEFDVQLTCATTIFGADGLGFVIQNTAAGTTVNPGHNGPATDAFTIKFSSWDNNAVEPATPWEARIDLRAGGTEVHSVDLFSFPGINVRSAPYSLTGEPNDTPYAVRITYAPGDLDIWVDGVQVLTDYDVDLGEINAVDGSGTAYLGFVAGTGGLKQASDITSWTFTSAAVTPPLKLVSSTINPQAGTGEISWESTTGKEYRITTSTDLLDWTTIIEQDIPATGTLTTEPFTFTPGIKAFFRIEEEPAGP